MWHWSGSHFLMSDLKVIGHEAIQQRFADDIPLNLLLVGPPGIGKHRLALSIAQTFAKSYDIMVLEQGEDGKPLSIGQIRDVAPFVAKRPFGSKYKIVIIDATAMTDAAAQALLRMLEESNDRTRFILSTSGALPLTILSRCAKVQVAPLTDDEVLQVLEMMGWSGDLANIAARLSKGSVETALAHINNADRRRRILSVIQLLMQRKISAVLPAVRKWGEADIVEITRWFEDLLLVPFGIMSSYTYKELSLGASFTADDVEKYLKLLRTPMRPSLKMTYLAIRILEAR